MENKIPKKIKILALDIANITGWWTEHASGTWNLNSKKDESKGMSLIRFRAKLKELYELGAFNVVAFERPAGMHKHAIISQSEKHGIMKAFCEDNKIQYVAYSSGQIKKFATGKGNCGKPAMIKACEEKYGVKPIDDNHADAAHLYHLAKSELYIE